MPKLFYQGHGSYRITAGDGRIFYVDPFVGEGYEREADVIFVTHDHHDHNQIQLVKQKPNCRIITAKESIVAGQYQTFDLGHGVTAEAVEAYNGNHDPHECVGFILTVDGVKIYCAGDTSMTVQMRTFAEKKLDYALFPLDGVYNMDLAEGAKCATLVGAKHNIPIHLKPGELFDHARAEQWEAPNKLILEPNEEIEI